MNSYPSFAAENERWSALQCRNKAAHSSFVYAVLTTKIYCRPTCPSRLARRANVKFFDNATQAICSGFRACKRCKPEVPVTQDHGMTMVNQACQAIEAGLGDISMAEAARAAGVTPRHLHTLFRSRFGCTPAEYARGVRWQSKQLSDAGATLGYETFQPLPELSDDASSMFDSMNSSPATMSPFDGPDEVGIFEDASWQDQSQYSTLISYLG